MDKRSITYKQLVKTHALGKTIRIISIRRCWDGWLRIRHASAKRCLRPGEPEPSGEAGGFGSRARLEGVGYSGIDRSFSDHFGVTAYGGLFGTKFQPNGKPYTFGGYTPIRVFPSSFYFTYEIPSFGF